MKKSFSLHTILLLLVIILLPLQTNADTTIISNSVSVNSNNGINTSHVRTVHNGIVVEDTTISTTTSPINYHSEYTDSSTKTQTEIIAKTDNTELLNKLNSLIKELNIILAYYEKLLSK